MGFLKNGVSRAEVEGIVLGQIPDNTLTDNKLSDDPSDLKSRFVSSMAETTAYLAGLGVAKYGINYKISTDTVTRIGSSVGKVANISPGINDFDSIMPWAGMRRCNRADDGKINAYYGDVGYIEDGSNGQVMDEVPAFYFSRKQVDADNIQTYISMLPVTGLRLHPWFYDVNGKELTKQYFSAFEGSIFDVSAGVYLLNDEQVADFTAATGDKLCSIAGAKPVSGVTQDLTIVKSRILSTNRGAGWNQQYFNAVSAIQMLLQIEYAKLNSQSAIGQGVVNIPDVPNTANNSIITGGTSYLGNKSGRAVGTDGLVSISYRGIENFWGNIWKGVDGFNVNNGFAFISNVNGNFVSDGFTGQYIKVGELAHTNGYMSKALLNYNFDHGYLPAEALGTSSSKYADYYYQAGVGAFVALLGGYWNYGASAGAFGWLLGNGSAYRARTVGARLCT